MEGHKKFWLIEEIKNGFERFLKENQRYPSAVEIDARNYLPIARQLQRRFGGVPEFRKLIGLEDLHFGKGKFLVMANRDISQETLDEITKAKKYIKPIPKNTKLITVESFLRYIRQIKPLQIKE